MSRFAASIRAALSAVRAAMRNDGLRRIELAWSLGIGADTGLLVILLVTVYARDGVVATGLLGATRMLPAVVAGMLSGSVLERFRGDRLLLAIGLIRAAAAALCGLVIALDGDSALLFALAAVVAAVGAPVRPVQATLVPGLARSPNELVAANMAWSTGEGLGAFSGPLVVGLLVAAGQPALSALVAAAVFLLSAIVIAGLRFEHAEDAAGGAGAAGGGLRLLDGLRALRRRPVPAWAMVSVFGQVMSRALLNALIVVASIELLGMGDPGVGILNAALGLGGLFGAMFALALTGPSQLIRTMCVTLAWWGAPIALIGLLPVPAVAIGAMAVIGIANAAYDVALFTIFQRGCTNDERAPVFSVFEGTVGLGSIAGSLLAPVLLAAFGDRGALAIAGSILPILALVIYSRVGRLDRVTVVDEDLGRLLRDVPAFAELPLTAVERLAAGLVPIEFEAGAALMRQGDAGDRFLVVASGEVEVLVDGRPIQRLRRGAGVGEIALLRRSPRTATVMAISAVTGYAVDAGTFLAAIAGPSAAAVTERIAAAHLARAAGATATAPAAAAPRGS